MTSFAGFLAFVDEEASGKGRELVCWGDGGKGWVGWGVGRGRIGGGGSGHGMEAGMGWTRGWDGRRNGMEEDIL